MAAGDLGRHFPDSDPAYRGISSLILLERIVAVVQSRGYRPLNVDITVVARSAAWPLMSANDREARPRPGPGP